MKYLVLFIFLALAYGIWRGQRRREREAEAPQPTAAPAAPDAQALAQQEMVRCPVCALHLPRGEAVADASGRLYCGPEHRRLGGE